jgi:predicted DNA-binding transcriptional regulator AlpA
MEGVKAQGIVSEMEYLDKKQLAAKLNCSVKSIINWTAGRRLPMVKIGRLVRYPRVEIEKRLLSGQLLHSGK